MCADEERNHFWYSPFHLILNEKLNDIWFYKNGFYYWNKFYIIFFVSIKSNELCFSLIKTLKSVLKWRQKSFFLFFWFSLKLIIIWNEKVLFKNHFQCYYQWIIVFENIFVHLFWVSEWMSPFLAFYFYQNLSLN